MVQAVIRDPRVLGEPARTIADAPVRLTPEERMIADELLRQGCGRSLGRYVILRKLATGGMAEVYVASAKSAFGFAKKVAVKRLLPNLSGDAAFVAMLLDEAKISVSLTHPNIAQTFELGVDHGGSYFLVMEHVEGRPLNRVLQRVVEQTGRPLGVAHAVHVIAEVAKGLAHAHERRDAGGGLLGIVHRDVSPQNVLLSYQGSVKVIDFGIARAKDRLNHTRKGIIKGKLRYLAPEIAGGKEPDLRADVFGCGLLLFELLTGEAFHPTVGEVEALRIAKQARFRSARSIMPEIPEELDRILARALARDRDERYGTARELFTDLRLFLNRFAPGFGDAELGDLMSTWFGREAVESRQLDALAEIVAARERAREEADLPTVSVAQLVEGSAIDDVRGATGGLSRGKAHVNGADGGRAMSVVPVDGSASPPPRGTFEGPGRPTRVKREPARPPAPPPPDLAPTSQDDVVIEPEPTLLDPGALELGTTRPRDAVNEEHATVQDDVVVEGRATERGDVRAERSATEQDDVVIEPAPSTVRDRAPLRAYAAAPTATIELTAPAPMHVPALARRDDLSELAPVLRRSRVHLSRRFAAVLVATALLGFAGERADLFGASEEEARGAVVEQSTEATGGRVDGIGAAPGLELAPVTGLEDRGAEPTEPATHVAERAARAAERATQLAERGAEPRERATQLAERDARPTVRAAENQVAVRAAGAVERATQVAERAAQPTERGAATRERSAGAEKLAPQGSVTFNARPVSWVWVDGKRRGKTPLTLALDPGRHDFVLESPDGRIERQSRRVTAGKNAPMLMRWE